MNEATAKTIYERVLALDPVIKDIEVSINEIADEAEQRFFRARLGEVMASIYSELLYPIEIKYPNFVPENERIKP